MWYVEYECPVDGKMEIWLGTTNPLLQEVLAEYRL
jgi:hypothetical protein